jgi:serine-type D-Ala-D-Ala carboxypeptidase/endopeptidase (penicillin-binding protein 4)
MGAQRGQQRAHARDLVGGPVDLARDLGDPAGIRPVLAAEKGPQRALEPEPVALEPEGVGVTGRQRVLDLRAGRRRLTGQREQRPHVGQDRREAIVHSRRSIRHWRAAGMGRRAYLRSLLGPLAAVAAVLVLAGPAHARAGTPTLHARLAQALAVPGVDPTRTAALAVDLRTGAVVFSRNAQLSLVPASNQKLPVAYAALDRLGPGYRFRTEVVGTGALVGDVWNGDLWLRGHGDPTLRTSDLEALAAEVEAWGIRRVTGAVVADESWFDAVRTAPGWRAGFFIRESPPLSALVVARGWYRGRTSHNPALAAGSLFRQALDDAGVRVAKRTRTGVLAATGLPLAQDLSEPLAKIVRFMGRDSDNFTAEMLVKQLGAEYEGRGTTASGAKVVRAALAEAGVPLAGVRVADGSGLSRLDRLTAVAVVRLLEVGAAGPLRDAFLGSLAVAGVDGTLEDRMRSRPARGRVIAKTGTTRLASALSGFVRDRYVFAVLQNGSPVSTYWARRAQDRFATALAASG